MRQKQILDTTTSQFRAHQYKIATADSWHQPRNTFGGTPIRAIPIQIYKEYATALHQAGSTYFHCQQPLLDSGTKVLSRPSKPSNN